MWGDQPWDNDPAADWYGTMMKKTGLAAHVRKTLSEELHKDSADVLRAAAFCLVQFGRIYVWPTKELKDDLKLGIAALKQVLEDDEYCHSIEITVEVRAELAELGERLNTYIW
ncbi:hypothetical protein [Pedobacter cryoconitis]|uniref:Uncharacterized protein n=1 Tax=Pedobacter cryoconitis TaxID=188932 RepID=A0A327S9P9_9SPHI|nr:hypothetical protein [Pedobacter cryoconitis]RAJ25508.1 hypothetical protein LY11_04012 [Pedobacter cryoconitis]